MDNAIHTKSNTTPLVVDDVQKETPQKPHAARTMEKLGKNANLEDFSSVLAQMLEQNSKDFKQQNLQNLFKNDVVKQNNKMLENMLNTKELIPYIGRKQIKRSIAISMEYWDLLKTSKSTIKFKKDQIETLLDCCKEWNAIITKQRKLKDGEKMSDDEIEFVEFVCEEFKEWFKDEPKIEAIKHKWNALYKKLRNEQLWWQRKRTEINGILQEKRDDLTKEAREKLNKSTTWMGSLLVGVGTALQIASAVITVCGGFGIGPAVPSGVTSGMKTVGAGMKTLGNQINKKHAQKNEAEAERLMREAAEAQRLMKRMDGIYASFYSMTQDAGKMDQLFSDFMDSMKSQSKSGGKIFDGMNRKGKAVNLVMLQTNVKRIIASFKALQATSNRILQTIDNAQNRFNSN